jgi:Protein of unknown function (DUF3151)
VSESRRDLLAGAPATLLPADPNAEALAQARDAHLVALVAAAPASSLGWASLAERALAVGTPESDVIAYAFARTGYHRGLDALRRAGWKGSGPIPWEHEPNRGFLRALWALSVAAGRIGETDEMERCAQFLRDSSEKAYFRLTGAGRG